jgi:Mg-chelatase subunit ChlD
VKRVDRTIVFLTLSALDTLATAIGVFVLLVAFLMPYYRNSFDLESTLEATRVAHERNAAQLEGVEAQLAEETEKAAAATAEAQAVTARIASLQKQTAVPPPRRPALQPSGQPVVAELDLVFAIDTTASMGPVLKEVARSMASIVRILESLVPSVRIGVIAYRDWDAEPPVIMTLPLTSTRDELQRILTFVGNLRESRLGSYPIQEELRLGLYTAMALPLRPSARQAIVIIGDAAAHIPVQTETIERTRQFAAASDRRTISTLFVTTPSSLSIGNTDRAFFVKLAEAGRGVFSDHVGRMTESILLSVLAE